LTRRKFTPDLFERYPPLENHVWHLKTPSTAVVAGSPYLDYRDPNTGGARGDPTSYSSPARFSSSSVILG
ncbi:MAG: hypothetical protein P8K66_02370, partial [Planctomycetota bacterium]|nr:hypothetical protein [Planctomycetota bacterium]